MSNAKRTMQNECYSCKHRRIIPGDCHISCAKPDPEMRGSEYGYSCGWFFYPIIFDPTWKEKFCNNYRGKNVK